MFEHPRKAGEAASEAIGRPRLETSALFLLATLAVVWGWWGWQEGAYFGVVLLPGAIVLCAAAVVLSIRAPWRIDLRLPSPAAIALVALIALGLWTALSALWSPAPDVAILDGERVLVYALVFALGIWLCNLLGPRMELAVLPIVAGAGFAGIATIIALFGPDPAELLEIDGTLDYPLGYRNANVAFFAIALFPAVAMASNRGLDFRARGAALAVASICTSLFLLGQSRASVPAITVALLAYILLSPHRIRTLCWFALAVLPALAIVPSMLDLYSAANDSLAAASGEMHAVARMLAVIAFSSIVLGAFAARFERRLPGLGSRDAAANSTVARALVGLAVVGGVGFVIAVGDPIDWVADRATEFTETGSPNLREQPTHFSFNAGSGRYDVWRVALDDFAEDPLFGDGAGGYQYTYLLKREETSRDARDAHSVELEHLAELGLPGFALLMTALIAATIGALRPRPLGPAASNLSAAALACGAYWLVHASVDWFWPYPAVTAPVMMMAGAACAPALLTLTPPRGRQWRTAGIMALVVLALLALPLLFSERFINSAYSNWRDDPDRAFSDLDAAAKLNPLSDEPLLAEAVIARELGDEARAIRALTDATEKRPAEWAGHYLLAQLRAEDDPLLARNEARVALALNPRSPRVQALADDLGVR